jgi:hypothetical protein
VIDTLAVLTLFTVLHATAEETNGDTDRGRSTCLLIPARHQRGYEEQVIWFAKRQ